METISRLSSVLENGSYHRSIKPSHTDYFHSARELTIDAAQAAQTGRRVKSKASSRGLSFAKLRKLLDSRNDRDVLEGLRKVISVVYSTVTVTDED